MTTYDRTKFVCVCCFFMALFVLASMMAPSHKYVLANEAQGPTPVDMYLIGGQSNAAGYSLKGDLDGVFPNVAYAGAVNFSLSSKTYQSNYLASFSDFKTSVTAGLGADTSRIGPEYGMAEVMNGNYAGDKKAFIFKSAAGGTSLRDVNSGYNASYGNWYPRSMWEGRTPKPYDDTNPMGVQYYLFVENFRNVYNALVENGYAPKIKGMAWMQGEDDLGYDNTYEQLLTMFINDIRSDICEITGDETLSQMPFVIGKIATSFDGYANPRVPSFNEMQQRVADSMVNVATVETSDLIIVNPDDSVNGTDRYHFNACDAETLGQRFGEKLLELGERPYVAVSAEKGYLSYAFNDDNDLVFTLSTDSDRRLKSFLVNGEDRAQNVSEWRYTIKKANFSMDSYIAEAVFADFINLSAKNGELSFEYNKTNDLVLTFTPYKNYKVSSFKINGVDKTSELNGLSYVIAAQDLNADYYDLDVEYAEKAKYHVTYEDMFGKVGSFYEKTDYCLEGATLKVKVSINKDYYVTSVKYGGIEMMYNEKTDTYDIVPTEDGKVVVYYGSKEKGTEEKSGCSGNIDAGILAGAVSLLAVVAYVVSFKDKCKRLTK